MTDPSLTLIWLQERTEFGQLAPEVLTAIAAQVTDFTLTAGATLLATEEKEQAVYILRQGQLECGASKTCLLPGSVINLGAFIVDLHLGQPIKSLSNCEFWRLSGDTVRQLLRDYPQISQLFSQQLIREVKDLSAKLSFEQERQRILRPYLVPAAKRAIMGKSRYAQKLRSQIHQASGSREAVLVFGEPGLEKDNAAALIHFGSPQAQQEVMIKVNCALLSASGQELFGRAGGKPGILDALGQGTLLLNNIQELNPLLLPAIAHLICEGLYQPVTQLGEPLAAEKTSRAKMIAVAENIIPKLTPLFPVTIKIPPLRVRKADIDDYVHYYLALICKSKGITISNWTKLIT